jgi:hypothetical protein
MAWHTIFETHHIPVSESQLLPKVKKYVFYLLFGKWDIVFGSPRGRVHGQWFTEIAKVAEIGCRRAPTVGRL